MRREVPDHLLVIRAQVIGDDVDQGVGLPDAVGIADAEQPVGGRSPRR